MERNVFGVGFVGVGEYNSYKNRDAYRCWSSMMRRCYSEAYHATKPTYSECIVCNDWHDFQNFAAWYYENKIEGHQLDKDILGGGGVYSPETCSFVMVSENVEKALAKSFSFTSPQGDLVEVYNLNKFCREAGLCPSNMSKVANGKRKSCHGWKLSGL